MNRWESAFLYTILEWTPNAKLRPGWRLGAIADKRCWKAGGIEERAVVQRAGLGGKEFVLSTSYRTQIFS